MKFAIITHVHHIQADNQYFGYAPYVSEMNIWLKYVDEVIVVAPLVKVNPTPIDLAYHHQRINFIRVPDFSFTNFKNNFSAIFKLPIILWKTFWVMKYADHIHLRCPGNMGLIGCILQIFFPNKTKTAKYAGNWDPKSKQPWTYKLQKKILSNSFLTRNMKVLVYGDWNNQSQNIKSFFTATYSDSEKKFVEKTGFNSIVEFIFVGSLVSGKKPMYAIKLAEKLIQNGENVILNLYGDGIEKTIIEDYIKFNQLEKNVFLQGNQNREKVKEAYQKSHFVILPSKSEGWPKAIAEGMFWGCVPIATSVSCVPYMLDYGNRGVLLEMDLKGDVVKVEKILINENDFFSKSQLASDWSQNYTTDIFEEEIKKLLEK